MVVQRVTKLACIVAALIVVGTVGFTLVERWPLLDALYMTVITISTVGFGEINQLGPAGRVFTASLILVSIVCMCCWTAGITSVFVEGDIRGVFLHRRMKRMATRMKDHIIVCGSGVFARSILELLYGGRHQLVVVSDRAAFELRYGSDLPVVGQYIGNLNNNGEDVDLIDGTGAVVFTVNYGDNDPWPLRADGAGGTLQLRSAATPQAEQSKYYSWRGSTEFGGSPAGTTVWTGTNTNGTPAGTHCVNWIPNGIRR